MTIRLPIAAGTFYPADPDKLIQTINSFLNKVQIKESFIPRALIVPHAGYEFSGLVAAYAYKLIQNKSYSRIILLGPSHYFSFEGIASSPAQKWQTPLGLVPILHKSDWPQLKFETIIQESADIHQPEHCLEVQIPFLQIVLLQKFKIFPLITNNVDAQKAASVLASILDKKSLLVVSSDLSHYLPYTEAQKIDQRTIKAILSNNPEKFQKEGEACGKTAITILINIAQQKHWQPHLLKALNSGDITGDKTRVVGYASFAYSVEN